MIYAILSHIDADYVERSPPYSKSVIVTPQVFTARENSSSIWHDIAQIVLMFKYHWRNVRRSPDFVVGWGEEARAHTRPLGACGTLVASSYFRPQRNLQNSAFLLAHPGVVKLSLFHISLPFTVLDDGETLRVLAVCLVWKILDTLELHFSVDYLIMCSASSTQYTRVGQMDRQTDRQTPSHWHHAVRCAMYTCVIVNTIFSDYIKK